MITLTKEWLLKTIAELEEERDAMPGAVNEDAAMALEAMKIALASLEAEAVALRDERSGCGGISKKPGFNDLPHGTPLYAAPPAPAVTEMATWADAPVNCENVDWAQGWNACRAAMLQGAEPVTTAYKLRDAVEVIRNSGIAIDGEKILAERDALNSPVIPDGWVMVPVEPTEDMIVNGFESEPDESFSDEKEWEEYDAMSGCQQAAHRAKLCWAAMIAAAPKPE